MFKNVYIQVMVVFCNRHMPALYQKFLSSHAENTDSNLKDIPNPKI